VPLAKIICHWKKLFATGKNNLLTVKLTVCCTMLSFLQKKRLNRYI